MVTIRLVGVPKTVLRVHVDRGSLSTNHELASQTHHQMPTF